MLLLIWLTVTYITICAYVSSWPRADSNVDSLAAMHTAGTFKHFAQQSHWNAVGGMHTLQYSAELSPVRVLAKELPPLVVIAFGLR